MHKSSNKSGFSDVPWVEGSLVDHVIRSTSLPNSRPGGPWRYDDVAAVGTMQPSGTHQGAHDGRDPDLDHGTTSTSAEGSGPDGGPRHEVDQLDVQGSGSEWRCQKACNGPDQDLPYGAVSPASLRMEDSQVEEDNVPGWLETHPQSGQPETRATSGPEQGQARAPEKPLTTVTVEDPFVKGLLTTRL